MTDRPADSVNAGARLVERVTGVKGGYRVLADTTVLDVARVIWCTGFRSGFSWIVLPVFDDEGPPVHERGTVPGEPDLRFWGLFFLHALSSETLTGTPIDARSVVDHLASIRHDAMPG